MDRSHYDLDTDLSAWHWWYVGRRAILKKLLSSVIDSSAGKRILEVGCSTGSNLPLLKEFGDVQGMEMDTGAVAACKANFPDIEVFQGVIPSADPGRFDVLCLFDVLEHIEDEDGAVDWIASHLSASGRVAIAVPAFPILWSRHDELAHHKRRYIKKDLCRLISRRFEIEQCTYFNAFLFVPILVSRLLQRLLGSTGNNDKRAGGMPFVNVLLTKIFSAERYFVPTPGFPAGVSLFLSARLRD